MVIATDSFVQYFIWLEQLFKWNHLSKSDKKQNTQVSENIYYIYSTVINILPPPSADFSFNLIYRLIEEKRQKHPQY